MTDPMIEKLEALADFYDEDTEFRVDGRKLAARIRAILSYAREEVKPLVCGNCGSTVRPGDYERINANPPTPAGTEGPGK